MRTSANATSIQLWSSKKGGAPGKVARRCITNTVTGMAAPTATTWRIHRSTPRGSLRGHTSKKEKTAVADKASTIARRKSADDDPFQRSNSRSATPIAIVIATATRRVVFKTMPTGLAVVAGSGMTSSISIYGVLTARHYRGPTAVPATGMRRRADSGGRTAAAGEPHDEGNM